MGCRLLPCRRTCRAAFAAAILCFSITGAADRLRAADTIRPRTEPRADTAGNTIVDLSYAGGSIELVFRAQDFDVPASALVEWVSRSARAAATYFGRFPVPRARILLTAVPGARVAMGSAIADPEPRIRMRIGRDITTAGLAQDSTLVHEMAHLAIPDHEVRHLWFHEGMATYVETIARVQAGQIGAERAWAEFMSELPTGMPRRGDRGLDATPSWNRRYFGGALYFLAADVEIRKRTANRLGLQDALRAIQAAGGNLSRSWPLERLIAIGDQATGTSVLRNLYTQMGARPGGPKLEQLWSDLGIRRDGRRIVLDTAAPLTTIRWAITERPSQPLLVEAPRLMREAVLRR